MLHAWSLRNKDSATTDELHRALRRIRRDDIVDARPGSYDATVVTRAVGKAAAKVAADNSKQFGDG